MFKKHSLVYVSSILTTLILVGCTPSTAGGVRELSPDRQYSFTTSENYQPVYRKVLDQARKCYQTGMVTAQMVVQGDLYHDTKSGSISVALHGGFGVNTYEVFDIHAISENETKVTGYYALGPVSKYGKILQQWVIDNSKECGLAETK